MFCKEREHVWCSQLYYYYCVGESIRSVDMQTAELVPTENHSYARRNYRVIKDLIKEIRESCIYLCAF